MAPSIDCTSNLFCSEVAFGGAWDDDTGRLWEEDNLEDNSHPALGLLDPTEVDESIAVLVEKESNHMPQADYLQRFQDKALDARARLNAVNWILKVLAHYNFGPLTAALSINYLDRFLSRDRIADNKAWMFQLLSVACLSLAAKMEETEVPLDFQVEGAEYIFEPRTVKRMELLVMSALDWRLSSVTPFSYVECFIYKLGSVKKEFHRPLLSRIYSLVLNTLEELRFVEHRPSSIAMAATLCAIEELLPLSFQECKEILFTCPISKDSCELCFHSMDELFVEPLHVAWKEGVSYSMPTTIPLSPLRVLDASFKSNNESTMSSLKSSPSIAFGSSWKKRRPHDFCSTPFWV